MVTVLKTVGLKGPVGSNPTSTARVAEYEGNSPDKGNALGCPCGYDYYSIVGEATNSVRLAQFIYEIFVSCKIHPCAGSIAHKPPAGWKALNCYQSVPQSERVAAFSLFASFIYLSKGRITFRLRKKGNDTCYFRIIKGSVYSAVSPYMRSLWRIQQR